MEARVRERQTRYTVVSHEADQGPDPAGRLAVVFAAVTAAQLAVVAVAPSLFSLLAVYVVYSAAITTTLFVESWRSRRGRFTAAAVAHEPAEDAAHRTPEADERQRAA